MPKVAAKKMKKSANRDIVSHRAGERERMLQAQQEKAHENAQKQNRRKRDRKAQLRRDDAQFTRELVQHAHTLATFVKIHELFNDVDEETSAAAKYILSKQEKMDKMKVEMQRAVVAPNTAIEKQMAKEGVLELRMP